MKPYIPILLYHQVSDVPLAKDPFGLAVTPTQFAIQMNDLRRRGYSGISMEDLALARRGKRALPPRAVAITFDDGYQDNLDNALPVLQACGFSATVFVVASRVGQMSDWYGQRDELAAPLMDWDGLAKMRAEGICIGSHTSTHAQLDQLGVEEAHSEIGHSRQLIETSLGCSCQVLSYPYERFTASTLKIAEECGYLAACGSPRLPESDYNLWRVEIGRCDTPRRCAVRVSQAWRWVTEMRRRVRSAKRTVQGRR